MLKAVIIGFGGVAQAHRYAYWFHNKQGMSVQLVAACDADPAKFDTMTKINIPLKGEIVNELPFNKYTDWREMLEKEKPDIVDICLPTKFHESISIEAMKMGYNVLCEKPMADNYTQCLNMIEVSKETGKNLMIGQCVRFYPEYEYLQSAVVDGRYGKVLSANFHRFSPIPLWGNNAWREKAGKVGSCLFELNIHDIDVVRWIFGDPKKVSCVLESRVYPYDFADTKMIYKDITVEVNGAWQEEDAVFNAGYDVCFEKGILTLCDGKVVFTSNDGEKTQIEVEDSEGIMGEIKYFVGVLSGDFENTKNTPTDSSKTNYTMEKLFESADKNGETLMWSD